jgi:hypothetical protein
MLLLGNDLAAKVQGDSILEIPLGATADLC